MKIQLINYTGKNTKGLLVDLCNSFGNAESLDSYDLNIIDLTDELIWQNRRLRADFDTLNCDDDFQTLKTSIIRSSKTNYLYVLPKNIKFKTNFDNTNSKIAWNIKQRITIIIEKIPVSIYHNPIIPGHNNVNEEKI